MNNTVTKPEEERALLRKYICAYALTQSDAQLKTQIEKVIWSLVACGLEDTSVLPEPAILTQIAAAVFGTIESLKLFGAEGTEQNKAQFKVFERILSLCGPTE